MNSTEKKKKSLVKRILKWSGIVFITFLALLIALPYFFKDDIKQLVIDEVNKSLNAKLSMGEFDLTFVSTFPNMTIELNDTKLEGINEFKGVELANIKQFSAHVGFWNVVGGDQIEIKAIHLVEPKFDVRILKNGKANYDIVKPDSVKPVEQAEEPSNFKLSLKEYSIKNGTVKYDDQTSDMLLDIQNLNHNGKGDLTADIIDFETTTSMDKMSFNMDGVSYLSEVKTNFIVNLLMELGENSSKFTLRENEFKLNALTFSLDGFYEMLENSSNMDFKINAAQATFKDFLSLIPTFYQSGYESIITKGSLDFGGFLKGKMDDKNMPAWDFKLNVANASIKYPDLPGTIKNIVIKAASRFKGGSNMDNMTVDVDKFHADFAGNTLDATLKMRNPMTDPLLIASVLANVDLASLKQVIPMGEGESYKGKLKADVKLNGRMSAIDNGNYEAFKAAGTLELWNMLYKSKDFKEPIEIANLIFRFTPKNLNLEKLIAKTGRSDFQMNGTIDNYMGYVFREELLKGNFAFTSNYLDIDQLMGLVPAQDNKPDAASSEPAAKTTPSSEPILIPDNIDFNLTTAIATVHYNKMNIKNVSGGIKVKDEVAILSNLMMNTMGGSIGLSGDFSTVDHYKPAVNFAYNLKEIDVTELATNFITIEKIAPITKYAQGKISSTFTMKSALTSNLDPIYPSLNAAGDFSTKSLTVSGFKPLEELATALKKEAYAKQTLKDVYLKFKLTDGKLSVTPFDVKLGKMNANIAGYTSLDQSINYDIKLLVPKEEIPAEMIKTAEKALAKVNSMLPKLNLASIPAQIPVKVNMIGTVTNPKINTDFKEALLAATGNLKGNLENAKQAIKDTAKAIINQKINEVREDLNAKKAQIMADAQRQADKVKAEAKKQADDLKAQTKKEVEELVNKAGGNPFQKKAAEIAGNKMLKVADEKINKINIEADKKADAILQEAKDRADKIK
ncbi:MAG: hypothetical protein KA521_01260 [Crocinitomicaceae bacterium]|nr:hypothetical protein [Crocinitomicaceae bacterium]